MEVIKTANGLAHGSNETANSGREWKENNLRVVCEKKRKNKTAKHDASVRECKVHIDRQRQCQWGSVERKLFFTFLAGSGWASYQ